MRALDPVTFSDASVKGLKAGTVVSVGHVRGLLVWFPLISMHTFCLAMEF